MQTEYKEYMERLLFPPEAVAALLPQADEALEVLGQRYLQGELTWNETVEQSGSDPGRNMMLVFCCLPEIRRRYKQKGIPDEIFWNSMMDLRYKLDECRQVKGKWGTFVAGWYKDFLELKLFGLGRLEFSQTQFPGKEPYLCGGLTIRPQDPVITIHIPSAGPLTEESCLDAYRRAYDFFPKQRTDGKLIFVCSSWLLDPDYAAFLPPDSNILRFQRDFEIIWLEKREVFKDAWRVFGPEADLPPENLPRKTSVQRGFADFLAAGGKTGSGYGVFVWGREGRSCNPQCRRNQV